MSQSREELASQLHDIYIKEAKRQGDVRHKDKYEDLSENIKDFDRVLADFIPPFKDVLVKRIRPLYIDGLLRIILRKKVKMDKKPTIAELEKILNSEEETPIQIMPNGEVRAYKKKRSKKTNKPLTMREDIGGEYGAEISVSRRRF